MTRVFTDAPEFHILVLLLLSKVKYVLLHIILIRKIKDSAVEINPTPERLASWVCDETAELPSAPSWMEVGHLLYQTFCLFVFEETINSYFMFGDI
jgi:hypothetical protein